MAIAQTKVRARAQKPAQKTAQKKTRTAATPWGPTGIVEEVTVPQRAGEKRFSVVVQLLETRSGERLIRFAYTTAGSARRGPVTMRARDLERLRAALERAPVLGEALRLK
ncbi:MAG: hypothetical protein H0U05_02850 [Actinobacteria bacterium]|nr:hypothetical protein [Actinomycetota bacterium]